MNEQNITIKELAYRTEIKTGVLAAYIDINRRALPNINYGVKIANALNTTVEYLVLGMNRKKCSVCEYESTVKKLRKLSTKKLEAVNSIIDVLIGDDEY